MCKFMKRLKHLALSLLGMATLAQSETKGQFIPQEGGNSKVDSKSPLTPAQIKARMKSKAARKARRKFHGSVRKKKYRKQSSIKSSKK